MLTEEEIIAMRGQLNPDNDNVVRRSKRLKRRRQGYTAESLRAVYPVSAAERAEARNPVGVVCARRASIPSVWNAARCLWYAVVVFMRSKYNNRGLITFSPLLCLQKCINGVRYGVNALKM